jgi:hypothetical protein
MTEPPESKVKKKRTDRTETYKRKKELKEYVVKASLIGHLRTPEIYPILQNWISVASKTMHRGSLVFNRLLLYCLEQQLELPDLNDQSLYIQCFKVGVRNDFRVNTGPILEVWSSYFKNFPITPKMTGDTQMFCYTAKNYSVMFQNSLKFCFEKRQKLHICKWLKENNLEPQLWHSVRCAINNWKCKTEPPKEALEFIQDQRMILNPPEEGINLKWIEKNPNRIVVYFWKILRYLEQFSDTKRFTLAPIHRISSHFLTIDTKILYYLMKEAKFFDSKKINESEFRKDKEIYFDIVFDFKRLTKGQFTYNVQTDGVSVCFHFERPKINTPKKIQTEHFKRKIAIDPGRSNLIFGVEQLIDGSVQTYKLTRKQYYFSSGMTRRNKKASKWQKDIKEREIIFSRVSPKTTNCIQWDQYLENLISVYDPLWEGKTGKKWAQESFRVYGLKRKVLDRFFQNMKGDSKPLILYGAAKFNPNGKHELSAPTTYLSKHCSIHFPVQYIDEYYTSKVCSKCDQILRPVSSRINGKVREIRGLRHCDSNVCAQTSFVNRDLNAALNILRCSPNRPKSLDRGTIHSKPKSWMMCRLESRKPEKASIPLEISSVTYGGYGV